MSFFKKKPPASAVGVGKPSFIIAGLGNPGKNYELTHHNAGFLCMDILCNRLGVRTDKVKWHAMVTTCRIGDVCCLLMRPQTYMNNSGEALREAADFYKIPPEHILVLSDDITIPFGTVRIRKQGSAGGHNGLKSIIYHLNSDGFPRIKIGVGDRKNSDDDLKDYVLSRFSKEECEQLRKTLERAADAVPVIVSGDIDRAMNLYNG